MEPMATDTAATYTKILPMFILSVNGGWRRCFCVNGLGLRNAASWGRHGKLENDKTSAARVTPR
jgi:hypothetical protein